MKQLSFKRGSSFSASVAYTPGIGGPPNLADMTISSQIRTPAGGLVCALAIAKSTDNLSFTATATGGTAAWPYNTLAWDIKFTYQSVTFYSETVTINVSHEVTA